MQPPTLDLLPKEIFDEIIQYLDACDMMRFCRVVPRLNDYVSIIHDARLLLKAPTLFEIWPNPTITASIVPSIITAVPVLRRLMTFIAGFGGATQLTVNISNVTPDHINMICSVLSNNVFLHIDRIHYEAATVWLEQLATHNKSILRLSLGQPNLLEAQSSKDLDKISKTVVNVNPRQYVGFADELMTSLTLCTRLRSLNLCFLYGSRLSASFESLLLQIPLLADVTLNYPDQDTCLQLIRVLPKSAIRTVEIMFPFRVSNDELDGLMKNVGFVSRNSQNILHSGRWYKP